MDGNQEGRRAAAEEILAAFESKDAGALESALHSFFQLCEEGPEEAEAPEVPNLFG